MRNNDRIIAFNTENEKKALSLSKQLNSHFGLPIIDQLQFKRKIYTRGFFRLHANFKEIIDIDRLTKKTSYKISKINDLEYVITNYDTFFTEMSFAPESIKALRVHLKIKKTSTLEKNEIILTTQFRYLDWVLPMIPICFLICYAENELLILVIAVVSAAFFYLSINNRVNENFMIKEILNLLIVDKEDVIFYY